MAKCIIITFKYCVASFFLTIVFLSCNKEHNCNNVQIQPAFIGFTVADIGTFVLRKFKANDNYQNLMDTFVVKYGDYSVYQTANDTTTVFVNDAINDDKEGIKVGYDWQIYIPAKKKIVFVSDIVSEQKTGKCGGLDKTSCVCVNQNFSAKNDNQPIHFSNLLSDSGRYYVYIRN